MPVAAADIVRYRLACALLLLLAAAPGSAPSAQEVVGRRLFSDQLVISEPFVEDEVSLPSVLFMRRGRTDGQRPARLTKIEGEVKKRITRDFELSLSGGLTQLDEGRGQSTTGFENLDVRVKYQVLRSELHEAVASAALTWEVGGTGRRATGAMSSDTISPALLVGKGLGDLPATFEYLRPLAISGLAGLDIPLGRDPTALAWGVVFEYSLPYLELFVRHMHLPSPVDRFVPLVEAEMHTDLKGATAGKVRGTVNAGIVWVGNTLQIGVEAVAPLDDRAGTGPGVRAFVRIPLEEILGKRLGQPIFGRP